MKNRLIDQMNAEQKFCRGTKVQWKEHPEVITTVTDVRQSRFMPDTMMVLCKNGCRFQTNEVEVLP